jgi:S-adenosyl methyltransferase
VKADEQADLETERAHSARIYDYLLGGRDNYPVDREAAEKALQVFPTAQIAARTNRAFMHRAVAHLVESGIQQFLDVGTGIPTAPNLHQVAQAITPASRVVYVDNDPLVLAHAAALMVSGPEGRTAFVRADARDPHSVLDDPALRRVLDLSRPVGLSIVAMLHFVEDDEIATAIVRTLMENLAPGSYLVLTHATADIDPEAIRASQNAYASSGVRGRLRGAEEIAEMFLSGLEVQEPGIVVPQAWRPSATDVGEIGDTDVPVYAVVARKL